MVSFLVGILIGALIEQSYPFVDNTFKWIKKQIDEDE